jgi:PAS domain S-box-containing protein
VSGPDDVAAEVPPPPIESEPAVPASVPEGSSAILLDAVANALPIMFSAKDTASRYVFMNRYQARLYGVTPDEAIGKTAGDLLGPGYGTYTRSLDQQVMATGEPTPFFEEEYSGVDGEVRHWLTSKVPLKNQQAEVWGVATVAIDISERRRLETELRAARDMAEIASKAKSQFLTNMSHEIRTPLNGLLGMVELLTHTGLTPVQRQYVEIAQQSGELLLGLINSLLDIAKIEAGKLELVNRAFDLRQVMETVVGLVSAAANSALVALTCRLGPGTPTALIGDPGRLHQILMNLTHNALKFTRQGRIDLSVAVAEDRGDTVLLRFEVRDTGIGIAPDKHGEIFDAFVQADPSTTREYGGTGLGLAIARQLCEMMGGSIGLESTQGQGSLFWFTAVFHLPTADDAPAPDVAPTLPVRRAARFDARVLLVEDTAVNRLVAVKLLERLGCSVETACDGQEAVERRRSGRYDILLMDCEMPLTDGFSATGAIRRGEAEDPAFGGRVPIVALTANALSGDRERCLAAGMDDYIAKPFGMAALEEIMLRWLPERLRPGSQAAAEISP